MGVMKRRFKDRYDGRLIRSLDPFYKIIPYIMPTRLSAQVFFDDVLDAHVLVKTTIAFLKILDNHGLMPKALNRLSPLHASVFVTNVASLGIQPIYHHLYEIGTTSIFIAFGTKQRIEGTEEKYIPLKVVADERIADGYAFASAFKLFKKLFKHPERLEQKPENVIYDVE